MIFWENTKKCILQKKQMSFIEVQLEQNKK